MTMSYRNKNPNEMPTCFIGTEYEERWDARIAAEREAKRLRWRRFWRPWLWFRTS